MEIKKQSCSKNFTVLVLSFLIHSTVVLSQAPAMAPAAPGPTNITAILEKAGQFTTFIRLMKNTQVGDQINTQLNNSNQGLTIFAPTDNAFANLKPGTLNSLTDQQKVELIQFHIIPSFFSISQFQTVSNPVRTQAGGSDGAFPLNVTTSGNQVNITTGIVNATVANSIYTDGQIGVYQVDQVLLPRSFFVSPSPSPSPSPLKHKKGVSDSDSSSGSDDDVPDSSDAAQLPGKILSAMSFICSISVTLMLFL